MVIYTGSPRLLVSTGNILRVIFQRAKKDALDEMEATDKNCRDNHCVVVTMVVRADHILYTS